MPYRCMKNIGGTIILEDSTIEEANRYVRKHCREYHEIPPDAIIFRDTLISLQSAALVGFRVRQGKILVPFTRRCTGTCLIEVDAEKEDFDLFREAATDPVQVQGPVA
jgi:hypothetical protein